MSCRFPRPVRQGLPPGDTLTSLNQSWGTVGATGQTSPILQSPQGPKTPGEAEHSRARAIMLVDGF
ncbi:hypothetical protein N7507_001098 [Penicillium longicatenatum]|nr:hypothetical protein N7507_001098 [Penicillium longicatenatum]